MIAFHSHLDVDDPPERVFELLADMAELARWNPSVSESRRTSGARFEVGSTYEATITRGPIRMRATPTLVEVEVGRTVRYEGTIVAVWSVDSLTFEHRNGGTRVTFDNESRLPRWLRLMTPVLNAAFQRQAMRAVGGAKRYLMAQSEDD